MSQAQGPANPAPDLGAEGWGEFLIAHPGEILTWMRQLRDRTVPVNLNAPDGRTLGASIWSVDDAGQRLNFHVDHGHPQLAGMVDSDELVAVTYLDSIKLQFDLGDPVLVHGSEMAALQTALPRELYRFQRRSAFRVRTLERATPIAHVRHPALPDMVMPLRVVDLSIGGCALVIPDDVPPLQPGTLISGVRVELDADTRFDVAIQLQHVSSLAGAPSDLPQATRLGCEWRQLAGTAERALQRYIDQTQKRRRQLALD